MALPIFMVLVVATGAWLLPESRNKRGGPIDLLSAALSVGSIVPIVYAVKSFAHDGLTITGLVSLVVGLALGWVFMRRQRFLTTPLIDVGLFNRPAFTCLTALRSAGLFDVISARLASDHSVHLLELLLSCAAAHSRKDLAAGRFSLRIGEQY